MTRYYTGVGSRKTPAEVQAHMRTLAKTLAQAGFVLRSGGADGADSAFEAGAIDGGGRRDIFLPWRGFNGHDSSLFDVGPQALALAATVHPRWDRLGQGPRKLHARNTYQCLGKRLNEPSQFLVCWTPDGAETEAMRSPATGGTATAIVLAHRRGIPVFNLRQADAYQRLKAFLSRAGIQLPDNGCGQTSLFD